MRGQPGDCQVRVAKSLAEALALLAEAPGHWTPLAGGTDLMPVYNAGRLKATRFLDLSRLEELRGIEDRGQTMGFGALTTFTEVREHRPVHPLFPNLIASAAVTGAVAIQNRATLGGNLVNASPAADTPPSLLAYGAELELVSVRGTRRLPYHRFHRGYKQLDLASDELLARIWLPKPAADGCHYFRKVGTRQAQAIAKVCLAGYARLEAGRVVDLRIGLGAVAPAPIRAVRAEAALLGQVLGPASIAQARQALREDLSPIDDLRASAHFRQVVSGNLLARMLEGWALSPDGRRP